MKRGLWMAAVSVAALFVGMGSAVAYATPVAIQFESQNLGGNSWEYIYHISGTILNGDDISIEFDPLLYANLHDGHADGVDLDLVLLQPDSPPGATGFYDIVAKVDNPSTAGPFDVTFDFLGTGTPGSQPFDINFIPAGVTTPFGAVPLAPSLVLLGAGALGLAGRSAVAAARRRLQNTARRLISHSR